MNRLLGEIYSARQVQDLNGRGIDPFPTSITWEEGEALYWLIRRSACTRTLEVGMAYGLSTLFICQALADNGEGCHTAVDPKEHGPAWQGIGLLNVERARLDHLLRFIEKPSHLALPELLSAGERFDLVFIDGMHLVDFALVDFFFADKLLDVGGFVVFDDVVWPAIRKALAFILRNMPYEVIAPATWRAGPRWRRIRRLVRNLQQAPLDLYASSSMPAVAPTNFVVLRKRDEDRRPGTFYAPF